MSPIKSSKALVGHIVFNAAYFSYEIGMLYAYTEEMIYFWDIFWHLILNVSLFYAHALFVLPHANRQSNRIKKIGTAALLIAAEVTLFFIFKYLLAQTYVYFEVNTTRPYVGFLPFLRDTSWRFVNITGLGFGYWFAANLINKQREVAFLEHQRLKDLLKHETAKSDLVIMENDLLRSKVNFHFLFNTLNYLYDSVNEINTKAGEAVLGLSHILHFGLSSPPGGRVQLEDELNYVIAVFNISKLKSHGRCYIDYQFNGEAEDLTIIPMSLIPLAENIMKYAELKDPKFPAKFHCNINQGALKIEITNKKRKYISPIGYGLGLSSTKKRLEMAYPNQYQLDIADSADEYKLTLNIKLL